MMSKEKEIIQLIKASEVRQEKKFSDLKALISSEVSKVRNELINKDGVIPLKIETLKTGVPVTKTALISTENVEKKTTDAEQFDELDLSLTGILKKVDRLGKKINTILLALIALGILIGIDLVLNII